MKVRLKLQGLGKFFYPAKRRALLWVEAVLLIFGVVVVGVVTAALVIGALQSRISMQRLDSMQGGVTTQGYEGRRDDAPGITVSDVQEDGRFHHARYLDDPGSSLALVKIPRVKVFAPVLDGTDWLTLNRGVGHILGTARPGERGNIGIAGHRDTFFRGLKDIQLGDVIQLQRSAGTDTYTVNRIQIVTPDRVDVLRPRTVPSLTLVTCYPFYFIGSAPKRFIVTASLSQRSPNLRGPVRTLNPPHHQTHS